MTGSFECAHYLSRFLKSRMLRIPQLLDEPRAVREPRFAPRPNASMLM